MTIHASTTGLLSSTRGQALLYDTAADDFRNQETVLDLFAAITQVGSREGSTLRFRWMHDDQVDNNALVAGTCQLNSLPHLPPAIPARLRASFQAETGGERSHLVNESTGQG